MHGNTHTHTHVHTSLHSQMHGNTHIPVAAGALRRHQTTGEPIFLLLAENFLSMLNSTRTLATGSSTYHETWSKPGRLGHQLGPPPTGTVHQESCVTHNTLHLAAELFRQTRAPRYADFIERLLLNGVLGTQRGSQPGQESITVQYSTVQYSNATRLSTRPGEH